MTRDQQFEELREKPLGQQADCLAYVWGALEAAERYGNGTTFTARSLLDAIAAHLGIESQVVK